MFRRSYTSAKLLAALLPLAVFINWAACLSVCDELTAHADRLVESRLVKNADGCSGLTGQTDGCMMTADAVVAQEKQTLKTAALSTVHSFQTAQRVQAAWVALMPATKQNSPPAFALPPLFLRLCSFRI